MKHPVYDLEYWIRQYPLQREPSHTGGDWWDARPVFSPSGIALNEQIRQAIWGNLADFEKIPCDVFAWAWGEPADRTMTKIGGVPYMDQSDCWPLDDEGRPMAFVMQVNFEDSLDLVGDLPANLLLVFSKVYHRGRYIALECDPDREESCCFKWVDPQDVQWPLEKVLPTPLDLWPLHGHIFRTFDVPSLDLMNRSKWDSAVSEHPLYQNALPPAIYLATKIGGVPHWAQGQDCDISPRKSRFLCQLASDGSADGHVYIGNLKPIEWEERENIYSHWLRFGDVGSLYVFRKKGKTVFRLQA
ncbi:MAG: DUF1963 domain-containing protein [Planctomycetaceae bacterium]